MSAFHIPKLSLLGILISFALIHFAIGKRHELNYSYTTTHVFLFCFIVYGIINMLLSTNRILSIQNLTIYFGSFFLVYFVSITKDTNKLIEIISYSTLIPTSIGILQRVHLIQFFDDSSVFSTIGNQSLFHCWISLTSIFVIHSFIASKLPNKWIFAAILVCQLFLLFSSNVITAKIAFITTALYYAIVFPLVRKNNLTKMAFLLFLTAIIFLVNAVMMNIDINTIQKIVSTFSFSTIEQYSIVSRFVHYQDMMRVIQIKPIFGWGSGTFMATFSQFQTYFKGFEMTRAHNEYLQLIIELGIIGILIVTTIFIRIFNLAFSNNQESGTQVYKVCSSCIVCFIVLSFFSFPAHEPTMSLVFLLSLGMIISYEEKRTITISNNKNRIVTMTGLILVALLLLSISFTPLISEIYIKAGIQKESNDLYKQSECDFVNATKWNPTNGYAHYLSGTSILFNQGSTTQAKAHLLKATETRDFGSLHYMLGIVYAMEGDQKKSDFEMFKAKERGFNINQEKQK